MKLIWDKSQRHISCSVEDTGGANLKKDMLQNPPVLMYLTLRVLVEVLLTHISRACQHNMETPRREALSTAVTVLYLGTAGSPAKPAFLTVSWQFWMECAYVEGKRDRRGNDVGLFENTCINMFTSGSFLQVTYTVQQQIALYFFFSPIAAWVFYETTNLQFFSQVPRIRNDS